MMNVSIVLIVARADHFCADNSPAFLNLTADQKRDLMTRGGRCTRPDVDFSLYTSEQLLTLNLSQINGTRKCDTFVFDHSVLDYTATEEVSGLRSNISGFILFRTSAFNSGLPPAQMQVAVAY